MWSPWAYAKEPSSWIVWEAYFYFEDLHTGFQSDSSNLPPPMVNEGSLPHNFVNIFCQLFFFFILSFSVTLVIITGMRWKHKAVWIFSFLVAKDDRCFLRYFLAIFISLLENSQFWCHRKSRDEQKCRDQWITGSPASVDTSIYITAPTSVAQGTSQKRRQKACVCQNTRKSAVKHSRRTGCISKAEAC